MSVLTTDDLRNYLALGSSVNEDALAIIASGVSNVLCERTGRDWRRLTRTAEKHQGTGTKYLVVRHYPIVSVSALLIDGTSIGDVTDDDIIDIVKPEQGIIMRTDGDVFPAADKRNLSVTYIGGPAAIPAGLKLAACELGAWIYQTKGGRMSASGADLSVSLQSLANQGLSALPAVAEAIQIYGDVL